jgi:hypothetical protein
MFILPEFWKFIVEIYNKNITEAKLHDQYFLLENIVKYSEDIPIAIPFWSLFENEEYTDIIVNTYTKNSIFYDPKLKVFIFTKLARVFFGIQEIFTILTDVYPNDQNILDNYIIITRVMNILKDRHYSVNIDDVCDLFSKSKI